MSGIHALSKIQLGRETTAGTAVEATTMWRGIGALDDQQETKFREENIGYLSGVDSTYVAKLQGGISLDSVEATFEQAPHIFEAGIQAATPAQDGSGSVYIYEYNFPETAAPTIKTYTIEGGDNQQAEEMEYSFVDSFTLEGNAGEAWMISSEWLGRQVTPVSFTGSVSIPSIEEMLFSKTKLYIDDVDGSFGVTQATNTLLSATLNYKTGLIPKFTAEGQLYFSFVQQTPPEVTLDLTFEHDSTSVAEKANWRAQTPRLVRLLCTGTAFTTAGSTYSTKTMIIDLAGKWERFEPLDEQDGNAIYAATMRIRTNTTQAEFGKITIVNDLSSLP